MAQEKGEGWARHEQRRSGRGEGNVQKQRKGGEILGFRKKRSGDFQEQKREAGREQAWKLTYQGSYKERGGRVYIGESRYLRKREGDPLYFERRQQPDGSRKRE